MHNCSPSSERIDLVLTRASVRNDSARIVLHGVGKITLSTQSIKPDITFTVCWEINIGDTGLFLWIIYKRKKEFKLCIWQEKRKSKDSK